MHMFSLTKPYFLDTTSVTAVIIENCSVYVKYSQDSVASTWQSAKTCNWLVWLCIAGTPFNLL